MKTTFVWRKEKQDKEGFAPIYIHLSINKERLRLPTGEKSTKRFSSKTNLILSRITERLEDLEFQCKRKGITITKELIVEAIQKKEEVIFSDKTFYEYWDEWMEESKTRVSEVTKKKLAKKTLIKYGVSKKRLQDFERVMKYPISFTSINDTFYTKVRTYMLGRCNQKINTFGEFIKNVKVFCKWVQKKEPSLSNHFREFKVPFENTDSEPLKPEELLKFYDREFVGHKEKARLIFLFLCCSGMRISDYNTLQDLNISGEMITHVSQKTNQKFYIPFFDDLYFRPVYVVEQMKTKFEKFPKISGQKLNDYIEVIANELGVTRIKPTSKTGRRTFATIKLLSGVRSELIMKSTGHRTRKSFDTYVGIDTADILKEYKDKAVNLKVG